MANKAEPSSKAEPYTSKEAFRDIVLMLNEVKEPKDPNTAKLLKEAEIAFREQPDPIGADACVDHFIQKYPKLANNYSKIFYEGILKNRELDLDMTMKFLKQADEFRKGRISKDKGTEKFALTMAEKYFPKDAFEEVKQKMNDPHQVKKMYKELEKLNEDINKQHENLARK